jgi:basic amino acid/polyamine antiporter, APA family
MSTWCDTKPSVPTLVRAIGRWSMAALMINCIIGSGVFGLPSVIAGALGNASPFAWLFAAAATGLVMACFAEVASRFDQSGGVYLYTRTAFGRSFGIAIVWIGWLTRLTAAAANANLFLIYLAEFWPGAKVSIPRLIILTLLLGVLTAVNYVGVKKGATQSNVFTVAKLVTLVAFIVAGLFFVTFKHLPLVISLPSGSPKLWLHPILLLIFAYGGYETALMVGGEAKDPRRDYPFALATALIVCALTYTMTQWVIISLLPGPLMTDRSLATAAQLMFGLWGARLVSVGVLVSCYGYLSANILGFPRILFAQAEQGDMPEWVAAVHDKFRTPHVAIVIFAICLWLFSLIGSFQWNVAISAMARLVYYASVCAALPVLRRKKGVPEAQFRLPLGNLFALLAVAVSLLLFPKLDSRGLLVMGVLAVCIVVNSVWAARRGKAATTQVQVK